MTEASPPFECEVQARFRDINLAGHVDNVEAMRIVDEARLLFLRFAPVLGDDADRPGLLGGVPPHVAELMGGQRVEYRAEMRYAPFQPFVLRLWVSRVGTTSFTVAVEMRTQADHPPALVAACTLVFWDHEAERAWPIDDAVRAALERHAGEAVAFR